MVLAAIAAIGWSTVAHADDAALEAQMNEAGVKAVEAHWTRAFLGGDDGYLGKLLDADYVSVNTKGVPRSKADIIALSKVIAAQNAQTVPAGPPQFRISIRGTAAIVADFEGGQASVDVFHYDNGAWHAWYSQHTQTATPQGKI